MIVITIFLRTDIRKSIDLYKEASEAIRAMPSMFIAPFLTYLWLLATAVFFIVTGAYLVTTEKHVNDLYENSTTFGHIKYIDRGNYDGHFWYFVFALLWVSQFIIAAEELSLAGCVTEWYVSLHPSFGCGLLDGPAPLFSCSALLSLVMPTGLRRCCGIDTVVLVGMCTSTRPSLGRSSAPCIG